MNKKLFLSLLIVTVTFAGCANTDNATDNEQQQIVDELDPSQENQPDNPAGDNKLGYVRYTKDQLNNDPEKNNSVTIDRTKMANMITRIILRNDGFEEVATLVTDEEVLIAYSKNEEMDSTKAADMAKKSAVSAMPGYFKVYVSDNELLMQDIQSLHNSSIQNNNYDNTINQIIKEMNKSSQGMEE
ncbi:YhcN/YlaJ family sporulation lipoprotein [Virgibacillus litoralis]|uniref:Membrane protein n=1 Tax=Virgibacillus litoralis TaxID=578221 RepID=A0ABS4HGR2_9BACI|nr:YhcN/YlaJ family sporulation lipoprotein [Virgibacillus litoralis]MBP1950115.1 putative membrane protein [Virgibacillus litoralis]